MTNKPLLIVFLLVVLCLNIKAQSVDETFNVSITTSPNIYSINPTSDGRLILAGYIQKVNGQQLDLSFRNTVVIINPDGTRDNSLAFDNQLTESGIRAAYEMADGSIAVETFIGFGSKGLNLYDATGQIKDNFQLDGSINNISLAAPLENSFFVVASTTSGRQLLKIDNQGAIDETFGRHSVEGAQYLLPGNAGDVIVVGRDQFFEGNEIGVAYKVLPNGMLASDFNTGTQESIEIRGAFREADDQLFVYGSFTSFQGESTPSSYFRLNADGSFDDSFDLTLGNDFTSYNTSYLSEATQDDEGNYYIAGCTLTGSGLAVVLYSLKDDGTVNFDFNPILLNNQSGSCGANFGLTLIDNTTFYSAGHITYGEDPLLQGFVEFDKSGVIKGTNPKLRDQATNLRSAFLFNDGKILLSGEFTDVNDERANLLFRLNSDGTLDNSFTVDNDLANYAQAQINAIDTTSTGQILLAGNVIMNGQVRSLSRFNKDGSFDNSFNTSITSSSGGISVIKNYGEGKLLVAGKRLSGNNLSGHIAIIDEDGNIDSFIDFLDNQFDEVKRVEVLEDGSLIVAGTLQNSRGFLYKILPDGTLDPSFTEHPNLDLGIFAMAIVNEKIIVGGFLNVGGSPENVSIPVNQYSMDGELVDSESISVNGKGDGFPIIQDIHVTKDEELFITGLFGKVNNLPVVNFAKVSLDGRVDPEYVFDFEYGYLKQFIQISNDYALLMGDFAGIGNSENIGLAKIKITNTAPEVIGTLNDLETNEDTAITLSLDDLNITDIDDDQNQLSIRLQSGDNYTFDGLSVTPDLNFNGTLMISLVASDGKDDSEPFSIPLEVLPVNDVPVITDQTTNLSVDEETAITLEIGSFQVNDPDNTFPDDHTLEILEGDNYSFDGNAVTPAVDFNGELTVNLRINDTENGENFGALITVNPVNDAPVIQSQAGTIISDMDSPLTIQLSDLIVNDPDNSYPDDFTLTVEAGDNYTLDGNTITAVEDFFGEVTVPVRVNDGNADSESFNLTITFNPVASIFEDIQSRRVKTYPNPASKKAIVEFENDIFVPVVIDIYSSTGKKISLGEFSKTDILFSEEIILRNLNSGVYTLEIRQGNTYRAVKKIIIKN
ncbi:Ig-like domain-containing protein [Roseivirga sp.]|uniref:Ig-like domain-containing protein n=1 Tax=Roseivirga sp. TaxID=1964215 RepID=UPI003B51871C